MNSTIELNRLVALLSVALMATYPLDQLYTTILGSDSAISPFKLTFLCYIPLVLFYRSSENLGIFLTMALLLVWSSISIYWVEESFERGVKYTLQLFVLISFAYVASTSISRYEDSLFRLVIGLAVVSSILAVFSLMGFFSPNGVRAGHRISFTNIGLNAIAISMGYSLILIVGYVYVSALRYWLSLLLLIAAMIIFLLIIMLGTRSVIWGLFISAFIAAVFSGQLLRKKVVLAITLVLVILVSGVSFLINSGYLSGRHLDRISNISPSAVSENSRMELWSKGLSWYSENPFGSGAGNEIYAYANLDTKSMEAHNVFISSLIQFGPVALISLLVVFLILLYKGMKIRSSKMKFLYLFLFVFFVLQCMKGSFLDTRLFWQPLTILLFIAEWEKVWSKQIKN